MESLKGRRKKWYKKYLESTGGTKASDGCM